MRYTGMFLSLALLAAVSSGCTLCCNPYDYSNPVHPEPCGRCCSNARAGSAFTGYPGMPVDMSVPTHIVEPHEGEYQGEPMYEDAAPAPPSSATMRSGSSTQTMMGEPILTPIPDTRTSQHAAPRGVSQTQSNVHRTGHRHHPSRSHSYR